MDPSIIPQLSYSLKVELIASESSEWAYLVVVTHDEKHGTHSQRIPIRLDMMYEQIQVIVDNHLRQITTKLSATMRENRKLNKGQ